MAKLPQYRDAERPHLSNSRALAYLGCGWQYYLKHVEKRVEPTRAAAAFGRAGHEALADDLRRVRDGGDHMGFDEIRDTFRSYMAMEFQTVELARKEKEEFVNKPRAQDALRQQGDRVLDMYLNGDETRGIAAVAPTIHPVGVEETIRIPTSAHYDIVVIVDVREPKKVGDHKFGKATDDPDDSLQLTVEAAGFAHMNGGELPEEVYLQHYRRGAKANVERKPSKRSIDDVYTMVEIFDVVADGIDRDIFLPTGLNTWRCDWCPFGPTIGDGSCKFTKRGLR